MTDIIDRLKAYADINENFGAYTEANCAYDAILEIQRLREVIDILLQSRIQDLTPKPSDSPNRLKP